MGLTTRRRDDRYYFFEQLDLGRGLAAPLSEPSPPSYWGPLFFFPNFTEFFAEAKVRKKIVKGVEVGPPLYHTNREIQPRSKAFPRQLESPTQEEIDRQSGGK